MKFDYLTDDLKGQLLSALSQYLVLLGPLGRQYYLREACRLLILDLPLNGGITTDLIGSSIRAGEHWYFQIQWEEPNSTVTGLAAVTGDENHRIEVLRISEPSIAPEFEETARWLDSFDIGNLPAELRDDDAVVQLMLIPRYHLHCFVLRPAGPSVDYWTHMVRVDQPEYFDDHLPAKKLIDLVQFASVLNQAPHFFGLGPSRDG